MITIKNQTIHELIVNVEASTFTVNPPLDIHQGDTRSHVMLIKLRNNEDFISLDKDITYKMFYYLTKDKKLIETSDVTVINYYRGILSHVISNKVVEEFGSYTCYLRGYLGEEIVSTISFPIVISKTHDYEAKSNEVIITKEFYDELKKHLNNDEIHLNEEDRDFLDTFNDQIEELSQVIERDKKIKNYYNENVTPFISIPEGLLILTGDMVFSEKDGTTHVVNSPANINHKVENGTHYISIVSNNDVIVYREDNEEFKFSSILYGGSGGDGWQSLIVNDPELITDDTKVWYDDKEHNIIEVYTAEESDSKYAPKPIIVTNQADITDDTEIYNELNNQNQIEVYTVEEIDEKIGEVVEDIRDFDSQINALETEIQGKQDAGDYATSLELSSEVTARQSADRNLQEQIDAISVSSDVRDIVGTYAELQNYDTTHLLNGDIIKVLKDSTRDNATTYYRWVKPSSQGSWDYIGREGPYYTKAEADAEFKLEAGTGIDINTNKQIVNILPGFMEFDFNSVQSQTRATRLTLSQFANAIKEQYGVTKGWVRLTSGGTLGTTGSIMTVSTNDLISFESYEIEGYSYTLVAARRFASTGDGIYSLSNLGSSTSTEGFKVENSSPTDTYNQYSEQPLSCKGLSQVLTEYAYRSTVESMQTLVNTVPYKIENLQFVDTLPDSSAPTGILYLAPDLYPSLIVELIDAAYDHWGDTLLSSDYSYFVEYSRNGQEVIAFSSESFYYMYGSTVSTSQPTLVVSKSSQGSYTYTEEPYGLTHNYSTLKYANHTVNITGSGSYTKLVQIPYDEINLNTFYKTVLYHDETGHPVPSYGSVNFGTLLESTIKPLIQNKQDLLVSGTNIKTLNSQSLLGSGNIDIQTTTEVIII